MNSGNGSAPIMWRALNKDKANDGTTDGMFLLSEYGLANMKFNEAISDGNAYQGSQARQWCNSFAANTENFSLAEQAAVFGVVKNDSAKSYPNDVSFSESSLTENDKLFLLSAQEATDYVSGYTEAPAAGEIMQGLLATNTKDGEASSWWLRSPKAGTTEEVGVVSEAGWVQTASVASGEWMIRPALNLNRNAVLFTSAADNSGHSDSFAAAAEYSGHEWKLTLKDGNDFSIGASVSGTTTLAAGYAETTLTINHVALSSLSSEYTNVTAVLTNESGEILYCGSINNDPSSTSSTVTIPEGLAVGKYTLSVYGEAWNEAYRTDYATGTPITTQIRVNESCGAQGGNLSWYIDGSTLIIEGSGDMANYTAASPAPWKSSALNITNVVLPSGLTSIGDYAFQWLAFVEEIDIPDTVTYIGNYAFYYCLSLNGMTIPRSVTTIGDRAFASTNFANLTIPNTVTKIGAGLVIANNDVTLTFEDGNPNYTYKNDSLIENATKTLVYSRSATIPDGVKIIGNSAFYRCGNLKEELIIPEGVVEIRQNAFAYCTGIKKLYLPSTLKVVGANAFYSCHQLDKAFVLTKDVEIEDKSSFATDRDSVYGDICEVKFYAFPDSTIQAYTKQIKGAVYQTLCGGFCGAQGENLTWYIDDTTLVINGSGEMADYDYNTQPWNEYKGNITKVTISEGLTKIGQYGFYSSEKLTSVDLPNSLTSIGDYAFDYCSTLSQVTLPQGLETIGTAAFIGCTSLGEITIPNSVTTIGEAAFCRNPDLNIILQDGIVGYTWENGSLIDTRSQTLLYTKGSVVPKGIKIVGPYVFYGRNDLTEVIIPEGVTEIHSLAYCVCYGIEEISLPSTLKKLEGQAFYLLKALKNVYIFSKDVAISESYTITTTNSNKCDANIIGYAGSTAEAYAKNRVNANFIEIKDYLRFSSDEEFSVSAPKNWDGKIEYSCDALTWTEWHGSEIAGKQIFFRGEGNTVITDGYNTQWQFNRNVPVAASGNIMTLLNYKDPDNAQMGSSCFDSMFYECTQLTSAPELPATTLAPSCYDSMFFSCTALKTAPELPATTLTLNCYSGMFASCTGLTEAPELPATTLTESCYAVMFAFCSGLTEAPELPATTLAPSCYESMFFSCTALKTAPELPATTLDWNCYYGMFEGCHSLTTAPALPATALSDGCYGWMFRQCEALTTAPTLSATTLAPECYDQMFEECFSLTSVSITGGQICGRMFANCSNLREAIISENVTIADGELLNSPNLVIYGKSGSPAHTYATANNIRFVTLDTFLNFSSAASFSISAPKNWDGKLEYLNNLSNWTEWDGSQIAAAQGEDGRYRLIFRGKGNTVITGGSKWIRNSTDKVAVTGNIMMLLDYESPNTATMGIACFANMFNGWANLTTAPSLPATTLAEGCYEEMFSGCSALTTAPELPATTAAKSCYEEMFYNCTKLTTAPELPATTLADYCYTYMFRGCTGLTAAPELPATTLADYCYAYMFRSCTGLTAAPELPATTLADYCYRYMFFYCSNLAVAPELPATTLAKGCYFGMLSQCTVLTTAPELPATTLAEGCYEEMFYGCSALTAAPELPATELAPSCYSEIFFNCSALTTAPELPATTLADSCYYAMFSGCTNLKTAPELPATELAQWCYMNMFSDCSKLAVAPELPAMTLVDVCYSGMFNGCSSLTTAPALPATTLTYGCYTKMFRGCTGLTTAPELPATTLAEKCCWEMFRDCSALTTAPELPATTAEKSCYEKMFYNCTELTTAPELPATTLAKNCYYYMFSGCSKLTKAPELPATVLAPYCYYGIFQLTGITELPELPATTLAKGCYDYIFSLCDELTSVQIPNDLTLTYEGVFFKCQGLEEVFISDGVTTIGRSSFQWTPNLSCVYIPASVSEYGRDAFSNCPNLIIYGVKDSPAQSYANSNNIPFVAADPRGLLEFRSASSFSISAPKNWDGKIEYLNNLSDWTEWDGSEITSTQLRDGQYRIFLRGKGNTVITGTTSESSKWICNSTDEVAVKGNIMTLLDYETPESATMGNACFANLFNGWTNLTTAPTLPATTLAQSCYHSMFYGCSALTTAPTLPATTLAQNCYATMFSSCENLTTAPELPATTLASYCYYDMFSYCINLTKAPALPATTLASYCYSYMFEQCGSLTTAPSLPATTLADSCYNKMFTGCSALTAAPSLPATTLADNCYSEMFRNCKNLMTPPELPATVLAPYCYSGMFRECKNLTVAPELPATTIVPYCYESMFRGTALTEIPELPATTVIFGSYNYMFEGCNGLTSVQFSNGIKTIYEYMFWNCGNLEEVVIPESVLYISEYAFAENTSLTRVYIPSFVERIDESAFSGCTNLISVYIPESVHRIEQDVFSGCPNLTIYGMAGSCAESYAESNGIRFVAVDADAVSHIEIQVRPSATAYVAGASFDPTGMEVVAVSYKGTKSAITDYTITGGENLPVGITNVTASYTVNGKTYETSIPVLAVRVGHNCSFGNDLSMLYAIPKEDMESGASVSLTVGKEKYRGNGFLETVSETLSPSDTVIDGAEYFRFDYRGVAAKEMGDVFTATLTVSQNGKVFVGKIDKYSLKAYATERLANSTSAEFKTLLVNLLNYGAAAQSYFKYRTDALVNADLTDEQRTILPQDLRVLKTIENGETTTFPAAIKGNNIRFDNRITLLVATDFGKDSDLSGVSLRIRYTGIEGNEIEKLIDGTDFVYRADVKSYTAYFNGLKAAEFRTKLELTLVNQNGEAISETVTYSLDTYADNRLNNSTDETFKALLHATLSYADSAKAYFLIQK